MTIRVGSFTEIEGIEDQGHSFGGRIVVLGCVEEAIWDTTLGTKGVEADVKELWQIVVPDLSSSPYKSATFNQQCTEHILFGVPSTICSFVLSTALDANAVPPSMPCTGSTESMNAMGLGSYKFPNYASSSSSSSLGFVARSLALEREVWSSSSASVAVRFPFPLSVTSVTAAAVGSVLEG